MGYRDIGGDSPETRISGNVFPSAFQPRGLTASVYWGDAGDGERPFDPPLGNLDPANAGRDTLPTLHGGPGSPTGDSQWDPSWGMAGANTSFRYRFLNSLNLGKLFRPTIGSYMNGRSDMRPVATAIHPRAFGEAKPVQSLTGGRTMAPGRVTNWEQASLVWPRFGRDRTNGNA